MNTLVTHDVFQFRTIKEKGKGKSLKSLSLEAHKDAEYFAFSKRSSLLISLNFKDSIVPFNQNYPQHG